MTLWCNFCGHWAGGEECATTARVAELEAALENERIALASQGMDLLPSTQAVLGAVAAQETRGER